MNYYKMKEKHRRSIERMYKRRIAGLMTPEQFFHGIDRLIRQDEKAAKLDPGFLADMATDHLRSSGLTEKDDLWPWISRTFRICWSEWYGNYRIKNAVRLACIRVFGA